MAILPLKQKWRQERQDIKYKMYWLAILIKHFLLGLLAWAFKYDGVNNE